MQSRRIASSPLSTKQRERNLSSASALGFPIVSCFRNLYFAFAVFAAISIPPDQRIRISLVGSSEHPLATLITRLLSYAHAFSVPKLGRKLKGVGLYHCLGSTTTKAAAQCLVCLAIKSLSRSSNTAWRRFNVAADVDGDAQQPRSERICIMQCGPRQPRLGDGFLGGVFSVHWTNERRGHTQHRGRERRHLRRETFRTRPMCRSLPLHHPRRRILVRTH